MPDGVVGEGGACAAVPFWSEKLYGKGTRLELRRLRPRRRGGAPGAVYNSCGILSQEATERSDGNTDVATGYLPESIM